MTPQIRPVDHLVTAHRQSEGGGFIVRRPLPVAGLEMVDPFLLIDELGPIDYAPGQAVGAPDHPHRGFETVSYILEGETEHADSSGHRGSLGAGDVQWMTAGAGIVHAEMPSRRMQERGGRMHGFQIWVNLPARLKMTEPRYQDVPAAQIPQATTADGKAHVRVVAGEALGVRAAIATHTPIIFQDWELQPDGDATVAVPRDHNAVVFVFEGNLLVGEPGQVVREGQMAILGAGDAVRLRSGPDGHGRALLLAGQPHNEPMTRYGPFVMNTQQEIVQAFRDYQTGRMGAIAAKRD